MQESPQRAGMSFPELKSCERLFLVAFQYENERQEILASQHLRSPIQPPTYGRTAASTTSWQLWLWVDNYW